MQFEQYYQRQLRQNIVNDYVKLILMSIRMMGINAQGATQYLLSLYCSTAVLVHDALGVLEGVTLNHYHEYT